MARRPSGDRPVAAANGKIERPNPRPAQAVTDEQTVADGEQTLADADQTLSDTDQTGSDRDQTSADCDQLASDRDQAASTRDSAMAARDGSYEQDDGVRVVTGAEIVVRAARQRKRAAQQRAQSAQQGQLAATDRDAAAVDREAAARERRRALVDREAFARALAASEADPLTGSRSRVAGLADLDRELDRCQRIDCSLVVAYVDVVGLMALDDREGSRGGRRAAQTRRLARPSPRAFLRSHHSSRRRPSFSAS